MKRILLYWLISLFCLTCKPPAEQADARKIVVLTFDDAAKSHITFVGPLLKDLGFGATFFISHRWMGDTINFMNWNDIARLHQMGFEIGNHSWSHLDYSLPENLARLEGELGLIDLHLGWQQIPKPVSFAYCGNWFSPEAVSKLNSLGYKFARRGMQPEVEYGKIIPGVLFDPVVHHPLLIPSAGDAYPDWTFDHFKKVVDRAGNGEIAVLQFHGVPDLAHPWVTTDPQLFSRCMQYLKQREFTVISMRELEKFIPEIPTDDPMLNYTHSSQEQQKARQPMERKATLERLDYWLSNMFIDHRFDPGEAQLVTGLPIDKLSNARDTLVTTGTSTTNKKVEILPYPGGRHPRIGFLDGAMDPMRGTKFSILLPDDPSQYLVVDLPEAIFSNLGLTFLAHRHIPTIWDRQHTFIANVDWTVKDDGSLENTWTLPNGISFGAEVSAKNLQVDMEMWLYNGTDHRLDSLKTQVCVMLKGASEFNQLTNENKRFAPNTAAVKSNITDHWILTSWERTFNPWGNQDVPCIHTDPMFEACEPGDTVHLQGKLWIYNNEDVEQFLN